MKYLFKYLPYILWYVCEGVFWLVYGLISVFVTLGYIGWHLKIPKKPMEKIDEFLDEITGDDSVMKTDRVARIVIGLILLVAILILLGFIFFFWTTLFTFLFLIVCFWMILFMAS